MAATSQLKAKAAVESVDRVSQSSVLGCCGSQLQVTGHRYRHHRHLHHLHHLLHHHHLHRDLHIHPSTIPPLQVEQAELSEAMLDVAKEEQVCAMTAQFGAIRAEAL